MPEFDFLTLDALLARDEAPPEGLIVNFGSELTSSEEHSLAVGREANSVRPTRVLSAEKGLHLLLLC